MKEISAKELYQMVQDGAQPKVIDVREIDEFHEAHADIAGIINRPLSTLPQNLASFNEIDKAEEIYIICRSGGRSAMACDILESAGFNVINVAGGTIEWLDQK